MRLEFPDKLKAHLKEKVRQKEEAMHIEDTQRLFAGIEMLKVVLYLVASREGEDERQSFFSFLFVGFLANSDTLPVRRL